MAVARQSGWALVVARHSFVAKIAIAGEKIMSKPPLSPFRIADHLVFTSGQLARGDDGAIVAGGIEAQAARCLANLVAVLAEAGCAPADVVKVTAWLTDAGHGAAFNAAYAKVFGEPYPARSTVVSGLLAPEALIEVEAVALRR